MSKRPVIIIVDARGGTYDANHLSIVKDGKKYALQFEVAGVSNTIDAASIDRIELAGFGSDNGGSDLDPWGNTMNKAATTEEANDEEMMTRIQQGMRSGRFMLTDTMEGGE